MVGFCPFSKVPPVLGSQMCPLVNGDGPQITTHLALGAISPEWGGEIRKKPLRGEFRQTQATRRGPSQGGEVQKSCLPKEAAHVLLLLLSGTWHIRNSMRSRVK